MVLYFSGMRFVFLVFLVSVFLACASKEPLVQREGLPLHHLPNGHFRNTDTLTPPVRDTMEADSLVPKFRTRMYELPIVRGNENLWADSNAISATWVGHSTFYIRWKGFGILTDPIFSERASPVPFAGPKRGTPPGRSLDSLPQVDLVIISHDHYDHLDKRSVLQILKKNKAVFFAVPLGVAEILTGWGIPESQVIELDWWESAVLVDFNLTFVPAHHTSRRGLLKSSKNSTLWGGWVIEKSGYKIWFAGDVAYGDGSYYEDIGKEFAPIDVSFLPIGSYKPSRFTRQHVTPRQAVKLHLMVGSKKSIAMHWGTFGMVYERLEDPPRDLDRGRLELNVPKSDFFTLFHGEIVNLLD